MNAPWKPSHDNDTDRDVFDRKFYQAEMLARSLVGDEFRTMNDDIQSGMLWALADLITDARIALDKAEAKAK